MQQIALFGGSFNPPHCGHREVMTFLSQQPQFDKVWVVPTFSHSFDKELIDFSHRAKMCALSFGDLGKKVEVCLVEGELKSKPSYMIDTLLALKKQHPDTHFTIVVGSDCKKELPQWKNFKDLQREADFLFIPRAGFEESPFTDISSTKIRKALNLGEAMGDLSGGGEKRVTHCFPSGYLIPSVKKYIEENKLYR